MSGATIAETVAQCELGRSAVIRAMQAYERDGWKAVAVPIVGRPAGSGRQLTAEQEKRIQQLIQDRTPDQLKLAYALWTRQAVSELIEAVYGVRLTVRNMGKYLKRWGFTPQRPLKKACEQSPGAVGKWVNEEYLPELNPDELLNADLKQHVSQAAPPGNKIALPRPAMGALRGIQKQPGRVESYLGQKDVAHAA